MEKDILKYSPILPENFTGVFYFTNDSDEDFTDSWNKVNYTFPAKTTSPILMNDRTPLEIQQIRKKFAKTWAEREFFKDHTKKLMEQERNPDGSPKWGTMTKAAVYTPDQLEVYIQRCLTPLPTGKTVQTPVDTKPLEDILHRDNEGELITEPVAQGVSLKEKALKAKAK